MATDFNRSFKILRSLWCLFLFLYFYHFPKNLFADALPERSLIPTLFFWFFSYHLITEYYFSSPFFQSGVFPFSPLLKNLFSFYFYPYLIFLIFDYGWWGKGQMKFLSPAINIFGLILFLFGVSLRLYTLFFFLTQPLNKAFKGKLFRVSRHPRYLATLIQLLSLPFVFSSFIGLFFFFPGFLIIKREAEYEDKMMREHLKREYEKYLKDTPLLGPILK